MTIRWGSGIGPYLERAPLAALFLGISSGFTFAMIGATLSTRLAQHGITKSAVTAFTLGVAGATSDIIIDAYRIELLEPRQLGVGSGMSQYGWRIGAAAAGALALVLAARLGWTAAYLACAAFALPAMLVGMVM